MNLNSYEIEEVSELCYLRRMVGAEEETDRDIKARIRIARTVFKMIKKHIKGQSATKTKNKNSTRM